MKQRCDMPRDKTENHEKIIAAACREFLEYGFQEASMRRIAAECGMSASGLYKHFASKEEMFAALVDPVIDGLMDLYHTIENEYVEDMEKNGKQNLWTDQSETVRMMEYLYDHFDAFRLIICRSQGTRYAGFTHEMAQLEENVTLKYMKELKSKGVPVKTVNKKELHLLVTSVIEAIFEAVAHEFSRKEALHYAHTLEEFYLPGWRALFGL